MTSSKPNYRRLKPALGTFLEIAIEAPAAECEQIVSDAYHLISNLEARLSFFCADSEVSAINQIELNRWMIISPDMQEILHLGLKIQNIFPNSFSLAPTCPHQTATNCHPIILADNNLKRTCSCPLDLGGIAKGYCVDQAFEFVKSHFPNHRIIVNAGGDLRVAGTHKIHLRIPTKSGIQFYELIVTDNAVATSSFFPKAEANLNSAAHYPGHTNDLNYVSTSVIAQKCLLADAMTKVALFYRGKISQVQRDALQIIDCIKFDEYHTTCQNSANVSLS